jgi:hypothetical protein
MGTGRSEVKEEGSAQPDPGDMSGARYPLASSRHDNKSERPQRADSRQPKPGAAP